MPSREGDSNADEAAAADIADTPSGLWKPLPRTEVVAFLEPYGIQASNAHNWRGVPPDVSIRVSGHSSVNGHTLYHIECSLALPVGLSRLAGGTESFSMDDVEKSSESMSSRSRLTWRAERRLADLRVGLHEPVHKALGSSYNTYFVRVHFAHRLRPAGTTKRLDIWCNRLAYCINGKLTPPWITAEVLRVLGAPAPVKTDSQSSTPSHCRGLSPAWCSTLLPPAAAGWDLGSAPSEQQEQQEPQHIEQIAEQRSEAPQVCEEACKAPVAGAAPETRPQASLASNPFRNGGADALGGDAGSTCTGGGCSASSLDSHYARNMEGIEGDEDEEDVGTDDDDLTEEVLRSGLPGLD